MSKYLTGLAIVFVCISSACSKTGSGSGAAITDEEIAKAAFARINNLWTSTLKPALTKEAQTYSGEILEGAAGGKAIVNGTFSKTSYSSSTSSSNSSIADVTITFQQYEIDGLRLDGILRFYDSYRYRMDCSSSGCASSTHTLVSYSSENGSGTAIPPISIKFNYNGKGLSDAILLSASKEYVHWSVKITSGSNKVFSFSY